jgi:hypothetical protein
MMRAAGNGRNGCDRNVMRATRPSETGRGLPLFTDAAMAWKRTSLFGREGRSTWRGSFGRPHLASRAAVLGNIDKPTVQSGAATR